MGSSWTEHVRAYAKEHKMTFKEAMTKARHSYKPKPKEKKRMEDRKKMEKMEKGCINYILPTEIFEKIFFEFFDSLFLLTKIRLVCKKWRMISRNVTKLDFSYRYGFHIRTKFTGFDFDFPFLKQLHLSGLYISNEELDKITSGCPNLEYLNICECEYLTDNGLQCLSKNCKNLSSIIMYMSNEPDLNFSTIGNLGMYFLSQLPNLEFIEVSNTKITDDGFEHLCKCPLTELYASNCEITLKGANAIKKCKTLINVTISIDSVTDQMNEIFMNMDNLYHIDYV